MHLVITAKRQPKEDVTFNPTNVTFIYVNGEHAATLRRRDNETHFDIFRRGKFQGYSRLGSLVESPIKSIKKFMERLQSDIENNNLPNFKA
jgi:hypothetical protein